MSTFLELSSLFNFLFVNYVACELNNNIFSSIPMVALINFYVLSYLKIAVLYICCAVSSIATLIFPDLS